MSYAKLTGGSGIQWPCNEEYPNGRPRLVSQTMVMPHRRALNLLCSQQYNDGKFFTKPEEAESFGHDLELGKFSAREPLLDIPLAYPCSVP